MKGSSERTDGRGEELLGLTERGAQSVREDAEGDEVLLEFGDPNRESLCLDVESGEVLFEFGRAPGQSSDLGLKVGSQRGAGAA